MRTCLTKVVVVAQIGLLAFMAGQREWVMRTGRTILLRTAPVDPGDPMRGDYARLDYEIAWVPRSLCRDGVAKWFDDKQVDLYRGLRDRRIYATVKTNPQGLTELVAVSDRPPPAGEAYIRGRAESVYNDVLQVRYGIEALFMQQGSAEKFEEARRGDYAGVPLDMEVAVSASGLAVLKNYKWEPLGLTMVLDRPPRPAQPFRAGDRRPGLTGATMELKNHSDHPVAIVVDADERFFRLVRNEQRWSPPTSYHWVGEDSVPPAPSTTDVKVLQPGESYRQHIDFTAPAWFVIDKEKKAGRAAPVSLETLTQEWGASFRIEYAPPSTESCAGLPNAGLIWHSPLRSRAFSPAGGAD